MRLRGVAGFTSSALATALFATAWFGDQLGAAAGPAVLGWLAPVTAGAIATGACGSAARVVAKAGANAQRDERAVRWFWARLGAGVGLVWLAVLSNAADATAGPRAHTQQMSPLTNGLYAGGVLVAGWAVVAIPGLTARARAHPREFRLDSLVVVVSTALFSWHLAFRNVVSLQWSTGSPGWAFAMLLVGAFLVMGLAKVAMTGAGPVDARALQILAVAVAAGVAQGALSPLLMSRQDLAMTELGFPWTALAVTLAAQRQRQTGVRPQVAPAGRRRVSLVPYVAIAATDALLLATQDGSVESLVVAAAAVLLTGAVVLRQVFALRENDGLLRQIDASREELQAARDRLAHLAGHDAVTGLANRYLFEERIGGALAQATPISLAIIDLDNFKIVNDRFGHLAGDEVLRTVARRMTEIVGSGGIVARLGGDEFAVLLYDHDDRVPGRQPAPGRATLLLERLSAEVKRPVPFAGQVLLVGASVGLVEGVAGLAAAEALRRADVAMYAGKAAGRDRIVTYDPGLDRIAADFAEIAADLRAGLLQSEFHLVYQPIVALPGGELVAAEALVRWRHPRRGEVPPAEFIPVAERTGLIEPLGAWILGEVCRQVAQWPGADDPQATWRVSVNISARQVCEPGFANVVRQCLRESRLPAERLMIEVTETAVVDNALAAQELTGLAGIGVAVALDDFGTGHSSLSLLRDLPVDVLKLDQSFVRDITTGPDGEVIARAMAHLAEGLRLDAIAEGVETPDQAGRLYELGYRYAQGYFFGRPAQAAALCAGLAGAPARQGKVRGLSPASRDSTSR